MNGRATLKAHRRERLTRALALIQDADRSDQELADLLGVSKGTASKYGQELRESGHVMSVGWAPRRWAVVPEDWHDR